MSTPWHVKRTVIARHDGQRRWDYAYQFLLRWALGDGADSLATHSDQEEDTDERRRLRTRFDQPATPDADD
jgi:hypothetical protein